MSVGSNSSIVKLKKKIMARIYLEYAKDSLLEHPDFFMLPLFIAVFFSLVSVKNVLINMPKDSLYSLFNFMMAAFRNTSWAIQSLVGLFFARVFFSFYKYGNFRY